jgi:hypothetical protein
MEIEEFLRLPSGQKNGGAPQRPHQNVIAPKKQKQILAKAEPTKKTAAHRRPPAVHAEPTLNQSAEAAAPVTRMSLLDELKDRLGQTFKLN